MKNGCLLKHLDRCCKLLLAMRLIKRPSRKSWMDFLSWIRPQKSSAIKKGNIIYDKETKDTELVKYTEDIETYMAREVLPHIPDAKWFWEEDLTKKKPVIKTGAEIPFTRYFYKYQAPKPSRELLAEFLEIEKAVNERMARLMK